MLQNHIQSAAVGPGSPVRNVLSHFLLPPYHHFLLAAIIGHFAQFSASLHTPPHWQRKDVRSGADRYSHGVLQPVDHPQDLKALSQPCSELRCLRRVHWYSPLPRIVGSGSSSVFESTPSLIGTFQMSGVEPCRKLRCFFPSYLCPHAFTACKMFPESVPQGPASTGSETCCPRVCPNRFVPWNPYVLSPLCSLSIPGVFRYRK